MKLQRLGFHQLCEMGGSAVFTGNDDGGEANLHNAAGCICAPSNFVYGIDDIRRAGSLMESGMRTTINLHPRRDRASLVFATAPCVGSGVSLVNLFGALDACADVPFRSHEISGLGGVSLQSQTEAPTPCDCITGFREAWCMLRWGNAKMLTFLGLRLVCLVTHSSAPQIQRHLAGRPVFLCRFTLLCPTARPRFQGPTIPIKDAYVPTPCLGRS